MDVPMIARRALTAALAALPLTARAQTVPHPMPPAGRRPWAEGIRELRIGMLSDENQAARMARIAPYRDLLSEHFGVPAQVFEAADYSGVMQGFAARQLEISNMGALVYARIWMDTNGNVEPLVVALAEDGSANYLAMMYVRSDSGIHSLADMRGRSLAWADPNSTSGFLVPRSELREAGINIDTYFSRTGFAGGHEQAIVAVLNRQYDAGVTAGLHPRQFPPDGGQGDAQHAGHPHHLAQPPHPRRHDRRPRRPAAGLQGRHARLPPGAAHHPSAHLRADRARRRRRLCAGDA
jgi:phosphonate transport system substrate-binding protein